MSTILVLKLSCNCVFTESVDEDRTQTHLCLVRSRECNLQSHFTTDSGWPQIVDAVKSEIKLDERE